MKVTFAENGIAMVDDARIIWRNFSGKSSQYNREGDRNFALIIPDQETADEFLKRGWNVKIKPPREEGETPFMFINVNVKYGGRRDPEVYLWTGNKQAQLSESTVRLLDDVEIERVNMDLRPYDWQGNGEKCSAYLQAIEVFQNISRFAARFAEEEGPGEPADLPWD